MDFIDKIKQSCRQPTLAELMLHFSKIFIYVYGLSKAFKTQTLSQKQNRMLWHTFKNTKATVWFLFKKIYSYCLLLA